MISKREELIEGFDILLSIDNTYNPNDKDQYNKYTLNFVIAAIKSFAGKNAIKDFLEIITFDAIIGNNNRHQGNWSVIRNIKSCQILSFLKLQKIKMAPIYDSRSFLGLELNEKQIKEKLQFTVYN